MLMGVAGDRAQLPALLRRASMRGEPWADEALADVDARGAASWIVREIVTRVAAEMADEMRSRKLLSLPRRRVLTLPYPLCNTTCYGVRHAEATIVPTRRGTARRARGARTGTRREHVSARRALSRRGSPPRRASADRIPRRC